MKGSPLATGTIIALVLAGTVLGFWSDAKWLAQSPAPSTEEPEAATVPLWAPAEEPTR